MLDKWGKNTAAHSENFTIIPFPCFSLLCYVCLVEYKTDNVHNIEARSRNHCYRGKIISVTKSECAFVSLAIQHERAGAVLCCRLWPIRLYHTFPHYFLIDTISGERGGGGLTEHKMFVFTFSTFFLNQVTQKKSQRNIANIQKYSCKILPIVVVGF